MGLGRRGLGARVKSNSNLAGAPLLLTSLIRDIPSLHRRGREETSEGATVWPMELKHDPDKEGQNHKSRLRTVPAQYIQYIGWPDDLLDTCCPSVIINF